MTNWAPAQMADAAPNMIPISRLISSSFSLTPNRNDGCCTNSTPFAVSTWCEDTPSELTYLKNFKLHSRQHGKAHLPCMQNVKSHTICTEEHTNDATKYRNPTPHIKPVLTHGTLTRFVSPFEICKHDDPDWKWHGQCSSVSWWHLMVKSVSESETATSSQSEFRFQFALKTDWEQRDWQKRAWIWS